MSKKNLPLILTFLISATLVIVIINLIELKNLNKPTLNQKINNILKPQDIAQKYSPPPTSIPSPVSSPKPLTFADLNSLYGPCVHLPVLFYHHIQNMDVAKANNQQNLTVATDIFVKQMQYLKNKGYNTITTSALTDFFDKSISIPANSLILTFDDGYEDFYVNVLPIIKQMAFRVTIALPTGLVGNPGYLTWDEIHEASANGVEIINHTWSHANLASSDSSLIQREITTADDQLTSRGYNTNKSFVYPYGGYNNYAISFLQTRGYNLAFTTVPGATLCKKLRFTLPRIRIGNTQLSAYGF